MMCLNLPIWANFVDLTDLSLNLLSLAFQVSSMAINMLVMRLNQAQKVKQTLKNLLLSIASRVHRVRRGNTKETILNIFLSCTISSHGNRFLKLLIYYLDILKHLYCNSQA